MREETSDATTESRPPDTLAGRPLQGKSLYDLYGAFPVKWSFWFVAVFCSERQGRFSSRRLRSGSRSARKRSRDRNASQSLAACRLATLVFRSALTPEHAER